jgi:hypothetical protein
METKTVQQQLREPKKAIPVYSAKFTGEVPAYINTNSKQQPCNKNSNNRQRTRPNFPR